MGRHKYSDDDLAAAVTKVTSYAAVLRELGIPQAGGSQSHIKRRIETAGIDTSHFKAQGWNKGLTFQPRKTAIDILVLRDPHEPKTKTKDLRRALLELGRSEVCELCGVGKTYNGQALVLEIDHRSGVGYDHRESNLRFLCPNCHSQQETNRPWKNKEH